MKRDGQTAIQPLKILNSKLQMLINDHLYRALRQSQNLHSLSGVCMSRHAALMILLLLRVKNEAESLDEEMRRRELGSFPTTNAVIFHRQRPEPKSKVMLLEE